MRFNKWALATVFYTLTLSSAHAAPNINDCFKKDDNKAAISICLASLQHDLDIKRKKMEQDLIAMIEEGLYGTPPSKTPDIKPAASVHGTQPSVRKESPHIQHDKEEQQYHFKKQLMIEEVMKAAELFEQYRHTECERHAQAYNKQKTPFLADFAKKTCQYVMTQQRMKILERSLK